MWNLLIWLKVSVFSHLKERNNLENLGVDGRTVLKNLKEIEDDVDCINLAESICLFAPEGKK